MHDNLPATSSATIERPPLREHPLYTEGMAQISAGHWQEAFKSFQVLQALYPGEAEVKELFDDTQMRAALAQFQPKHTSRVTKRPNIRAWVTATLIAAVLAVVAYVAYGLWVGPVVMRELRLYQIASLRSEADKAIAAGSYTQAREALQKLQAILPEDPQTLELLHRAEQMEKSANLYQEAKALMAADKWDQALDALAQLQSMDPHYRDLPQLLQSAQASREMDGKFRVAEEAFVRGDWATAIAGYEALRQGDLTFKFDAVQSRLFDSYMKYGQSLVGQAGTDRQLVAQAISQFSEALKLRPLDSEALKERHLAEIFLAALKAANRSEYSETIDLLQEIYSERPDYARNEAAELLYLTLLLRANSFLKAGNKESALADYKVAAMLPVEDRSVAQEKLIKLTSEPTP
jgi:tetratricopeptide (TPR) repeat protein